MIIDKNGFKTLLIEATGINEGKRLPNIDEYILMLNEESYAFSNISKDGAYTNNRFDGTFIANNPDEFGVILGHEFSPVIYRGQNIDYPNFVPSAKRYENNSNTQIKKCIDWVKKQEFLQLFKTTPYYNRCQEFQVLNCKFKFDLEAIAQHYEFVSNYLDITKDLIVAMFFAYTYQKDGKYYPINDFNAYNPTLYIGNLKTIYKHNPNCLKIIGFQSLLRPIMQQAMAIKIDNEDSVKPLFEKIELPKNQTFANEIFSKTNCGKTFFPNDFMSNVAQQIKQEKSLNLELLKEYCHLNELNTASLISKLKDNGYETTLKHWQIPEQAWYGIHREIDDHIIPYLNERIGFRGVSEPLYRNFAFNSTKTMGE